MTVSHNAELYKHAASIIANGGVIAFRTDTFYGLGADPLNVQAIVRIRELKGREDNKPILLLISDVGEVSRFVRSPSKVFEDVAARFWPGPLTIIGSSVGELPVELTAGTGTIGLRLPDDNEVCELVRACGGALTATSANLSGHEPARTADDVERYFPSGIDLVIDSGEVDATKPSTVVDLSTARPRLIREGAITRSELKSFLH